MRILIADDEKASCVYLADVLAVLGDCDTVYDGPEAVEAFRKALDEKKPYDLVCMDISMPAMDGMEAIRQIREVELEKGIDIENAATIVMITAQYTSATVIGSFKGGCDGYLVKPITPKDVGKTLREVGFQCGFNRGFGA